MQVFRALQEKLAFGNSTNIRSPICRTDVNAFLNLKAPARVRERNFLRAVSRLTVRPSFNTNSFLNKNT